MEQGVNLRKEEYGILHDTLVTYHNDQLSEFSKGLAEIETLLTDADGFHANQTSEKISMVTTMIRQQIEPKLKKLFEDGELTCLKLMERTVVEDEQRG